MTRSEQRFMRLIELNKDIHNSSKQIAKIQRNLTILREYIRVFSKLTYDKLALDAVHQQDFEADIDSQALRVILGRIKVAMKYFTEDSAPVSNLSAMKSHELDKQRHVNLESRYSFYISRRNAERRLCKLTDKLVELQRRTDGLVSVIRRLEEDNKALKSDIRALRESSTINYDANFGQHTWSRLAGVDLVNATEKRQSTCSQRRLSSLSSRKMSFTTNNVAPPSVSQPMFANTLTLGFHNSTQGKQYYDALQTHSAAHNFPSSFSSRPLSMHANMDHRLSSIGSRRSGALSDTDSMSKDDSLSSINTSWSTNSIGKYYNQPDFAVRPTTPNRWSRQTELA